MSGGAIEINRAELAEQCDAFAGALAGELSARLGRPITFAGAPFQAVGVLELADSDDPIVHQVLRFSGAEGQAHVVLPRRDAALLAALEQGASGDALSAALTAEFDAGAGAALGQVMESLADVLRRTFESAGMPTFTVEPARAVASPQSDPTWIDDTFYTRLRFTLGVEGFEDGRLDLVLRRSDLVGESPRGQAICFITAGDADRKRISELEKTLGASAVTLEPSELSKPLDERVLEARAIVIPWDLSGRSGLELAESLARDPRLADKCILLAAQRPTRAQVLAALRAGARRVLSSAFDADAIRAATAPSEEVAH